VSTPFPGRHPAPEEVDALLDPAGAGDARASAHVNGCLHCQEVSAGLVEVRQMLRDEADRVPSPPPDLQARIAAALADEPPLARTGDAGRGTVSSLAQRRSDRDGTGTAPARRPRWLAVAAGLAVLAGTGLALTELLPQLGAQSESSTAGQAADAPAADASAGALAAGAPLATGTDYRPESLSEQVHALLAGKRAATSGVGVLGGAAPEDGVGREEASGQGSSGPDPEADLGPGAVLDDHGAVLADPEAVLADPGAWDRCLQAIGAPAVPPTAVDLARWQGRDAAVLVLPGAAGLEVWVVSRDCGAGSSRVEHQESLDR